MAVRQTDPSDRQQRSLAPFLVFQWPYNNKHVITLISSRDWTAILDIKPCSCSGIKALEGTILAGSLLLRWRGLAGHSRKQISSSCFLCRGSHIYPDLLSYETYNFTENMTYIPTDCTYIVPPPVHIRIYTYLPTECVHTQTRQGGELVGAKYAHAVEATLSLLARVYTLSYGIGVCTE